MGKGWSLAVIRVQAQNLLCWCSFVWVQLQSALIQPQRKYFSQKLNYAGDILDFCLSAERSLFSCRCAFEKMKDDFKRNGASLAVAFAVGSSLWSGSCILWQGRCRLLLSRLKRGAAEEPAWAAWDGERDADVLIAVLFGCVASLRVLILSSRLKQKSHNTNGIGWCRRAGLYF